MRIHLWNSIFSIFFAGLLAYGVYWLFAMGRLSYVAPWEFFLMALATFRLVRLCCYDHITDFVRSWFRGAADDSFFGVMNTLLNCPWCTGLWFGALVVFAYFATPYAYPVIIVLAVAALATFFQLLTNLVGWNAEDKKLEVRREARS
ncbi:MAG TPA: DUF1360 domain-containing protein [Candidatus Paceibacterota bacterium]|nr:DUF1360 domain-containing protein [Candidatus Paceibacterota bacterium]